MGNQENKNQLLMIMLLIVIVVSLGIAFYFFYQNYFIIKSNTTNKDEIELEEANKTEELTKDSAIVINCLKLINNQKVKNTNNVFYQKAIQANRFSYHTDFNNQEQLAVAYYYLNDNNEYKDVTNEEMIKTVHLIFGNVDINNESFSFGNINCQNSNNNYQCTNNNNVDNKMAYSAFNKAIQHDNFVEIYENIYFCETNNNKTSCYTDSSQSAFIGDFPDAEREIYNQGKLYKHVFKKADDKTYYWYSSEPV